MFNIFVLKIVPFTRQCKKIMVELETRQMEYNTAHAFCMLDNYGYRHTFRICNTSCVSTATVVARTRVYVIFTYTLPVFFYSMFLISRCIRVQ
jgi:hypothetical protein